MTSPLPSQAAASSAVFPNNTLEQDKQIVLRLWTGWGGNERDLKSANNQVRYVK